MFPGSLNLVLGRSFDEPRDASPSDSAQSGHINLRPLTLAFTRNDGYMPSSRFAWGKLYLALADLACIDDLLPQRVIAAYRHLAALNSTNLEPQSFQRLKTLREQFARVVSPSDEDDGTVTLAPLSSPEAAHIAHEI